jgi:uncharacterized protein (DUF1499 family)
VTTGQHSGYPDLQDRVYAVLPDRALAAVETAVRSLPRWSVTDLDPAASTLRAEVRTAVGGFTDDVTVQIRPDGHAPNARRTRVTIRSRSRVGRADLGENARHIRALQRAMDARLPR